MTAPAGDVRLYIAPANFAAQGYRWARSAERLAGVGAVNMQYRTSSDFGFPADYSVSEVVFSSSGDWGRRQRDAVAEHFTHVLIEAERPLFGLAFPKDLWSARPGGCSTGDWRSAWRASGPI